jgi:hypothetical protein
VLKHRVFVGDILQEEKLHFIGHEILKLNLLW